MEKQLKIPEFITFQEMAEFWDTHDMTGFEDQLVEVQEPVFENLQSRVITVRLDAAHDAQGTIIVEWNDRDFR